jgi:glycosyltransferase involved in cell wall biosynthesis
MQGAQGGETSRARILFIINGLGPGGAERQLVYLATGLRERGWEVKILALTPVIHLEFAQRLNAVEVPVIPLNPYAAAHFQSLVLSVRRCWRQVKADKPAVLVGFLAHGSLFARVIGTLAGVPRVVTSLRSTHSRRRWHDWLLALTRRLDDLVVTNSAEGADAQIRARVTTPDKSVIIPNGFDLSRVEVAPADLSPPSPAAFTWLSVGGLRPEKGHAILLRAAEILSRSRPFQLLLAGGGPELEALKALAEELHISGSVQFLGNRDDIGSLIRSADGFVLPSLQEGLSNALIEALAGRLPAVSTDVGGCRSLLEPSNSGFLVPANDPDALAEGMRRLMDLPEKTRLAMGEEGRRHIAASFSMDQMISRWTTVLNGARPAAR